MTTLLRGDSAPFFSVLRFLSGEDVMTVSCVCRGWNRATAAAFRKLLVVAPFYHPIPPAFVPEPSFGFWRDGLQWFVSTARLHFSQRVTNPTILKQLKVTAGCAGPLSAGNQRGHVGMSLDKLEPRHIISCDPVLPQRHSCHRSNVVQCRTQQSGQKHVDINRFLRAFHELSRFEMDALDWAPWAEIRGHLRHIMSTIEPGHSSWHGQRETLESLEPLRGIDKAKFTMLLGRFLTDLHDIAKERHGGLQIQQVEWIGQQGFALHHRRWYTLQLGWPLAPHVDRKTKKVSWDFDDPQLLLQATLWDHWSYET